MLRVVALPGAGRGAAGGHLRGAEVWQYAVEDLGAPLLHAVLDARQRRLRPLAFPALGRLGPRSFLPRSSSGAAAAARLVAASSTGPQALEWQARVPVTAGTWGQVRDRWGRLTKFGLRLSPQHPANV